MSAPRVLHLNDCADVGSALVAAAARAGHRWEHLGPAQVRPDSVPANVWAARARWAPYVARRAVALRRADVVHVHYATSVRLLHEAGMPRRPYVLHLHGSDIRAQWPDPAFHDEIQAAIDGAEHVYYTNLDTAEAATTARPDAEYMPVFIEPSVLPDRTTPAPGSRPSRLFFASRWDDVKGAPANLELARALRAALPGTDLVGLDWGPYAAAAAEAGVRLLPRMTRPEFLRHLADADLAIGQATDISAVSELEALAIGIPLAALGSRRADPRDGTTPPTIDGDLETVVGGIRTALSDPAAAGADGPAWVAAHHRADPFVPVLLDVYAAAAARGPR